MLNSNERAVLRLRPLLRFELRKLPAWSKIPTSCQPEKEIQGWAPFNSSQDGPEQRCGIKAKLARRALAKTLKRDQWAAIEDPDENPFWLAKVVEPAFEYAGLSERKDFVDFVKGHWYIKLHVYKPSHHSSGVLIFSRNDQPVQN